MLINKNLCRKREQILKDMYMSSSQEASNLTSELIKSATTTVVSPLAEKFADSNPVCCLSYWFRHHIASLKGSKATVDFLTSFSQALTFQ